MERCPDCNHPLLWRCGRHVCSIPVCTATATTANNVFQLRPRPREPEPDPPPIAA